MSRIFLTKIAIVAVAMAVFLGFCSSADAAFKLRLTTSQGQTITIEDDMVNDNTSEEGGISFSGTLGLWTLNLTAGVSKPLLGNDAIGEMRLSGLSLKSSGIASTLTIELTDTDFTAPSSGPRTLTSDFNTASVTGGSMTFQSFVSNANGEFESDSRTTPGQGVDNAAVYTTGLQTNTNMHEVLDFPLGNPYSITQKITITGNSGFVSAGYDAHTTVTPEPGSMLLAVVGGLPILGGAWLRRRRAAIVA